MSKQTGWDLGVLSDMLEKQADERKRKEHEIAAKLGAPSYMNEEQGRAYWRVKGGVISYRFAPDGRVMMESRIDFEDAFISAIHELLSYPPVVP